MKKVISFVLALCMVILTVPAMSISFAASNDGPAVEIKNKVGGIYLSWEKVAGANEYEIYKQNSEKKWKKLATGTKCSYTDTNVSNAVKYSYRVRAVTAFGKSGYTTVSCIFMKSPAVKSLSNTATGVKIKWSKIDKADMYRVYRKENGGAYKLITKAPGNTTEYIDKKAKSGVTYIYVVASVKGDFRSQGSPEPKSITFTAQTKNVSAKNSPSGIKISWNAVEKAAGYMVYRKVSGDAQWKKIGTVKGVVKYTDAKCSYGKKTYYKVQAYVKSAEPGAFSDYCTVYTVNPNKKMVALTFDDGPYAPVTNQILDCLQKYNSRATFFVTGSRLNTYKDCLVRENKLGCQIGCHTYNHTTLTTASDATVQSEIKKTNDLVKSISGQTVKIVRAPGGSVNDRVKRLVAYPLVNWSVDTLDWKSRNTDSVIANVKKSVGDGSIVLMHDLYHSTGNAAVKIIPWLIDNGYQLVTVSEMMDAKGVDFHKGALYNRA